MYFLNDIFKLRKHPLSTQYKFFSLMVLVKFNYQNFYHDIDYNNCKLQIANNKYKIILERFVNFDDKSTLGRLLVMKLYLIKLIT